MARTKKTVDVTVDGSHFKVEKGNSLAEVLSLAGTMPRKGQLILLGNRTKDKKLPPTKLRALTDKGEIVIKLHGGNGPTRLLSSLLKGDLNVHQMDANVLSVGTFMTDGAAVYEEHELQEGDIYCDQIGMDKDRSCLLLCRKKHTAFYSLTGLKPEGRVISGFELLHDLKRGDVIRFEVEGHDEIGVRYSYAKTTDLTTRIIHDGTLVITVVEVSLSDKSTNAGDLFLHVFKDSTVKVSSSTGSFISSAGLSGFVIGEVDEEPQERVRGRVSVRNHGKQHGEFYFYRSDRSISSSHTMIGEVSKGMEIIDLAESGDEFAIITRPKLVNCIGMTQSNARDQLAELGHRQIRKGDESDGALIVYHHPSSTLMMRPGGPVETTGVPPEHVIRLRLFDEAAPVTAKYLRDVSGLTLARIGRLKVEQAYSPLIGAMLLNGDHSRISVPDLNSENVPIEKVGVGVIGVTNSVVERMGIIGIRMNESDEFGPTLEHFESSNIVGQIEGEIDALKRFKNGNDLYVMEAEPTDDPPGPKR